MHAKAVIFDMDGLLIDSEPCWEIAGKETLEAFGHTLTEAQYKSSTGLRTEEWIDHWFRHFNIDRKYAPEAVASITSAAIKKIGNDAPLMPGVPDVIQFFRHRGYAIGLATSSPMALAEVVLQKLGPNQYFDAIASAEHLPYGKPHPLVYLNCAEALNTAPYHCLAFEDSINGMIAAKAARMKCVVVPAAVAYHARHWHIADLKIPTLAGFGAAELKKLQML